MANKTDKLDLTSLKPGTAQTFDPVFEVEDVEGRGKMDGDYIHATLKPVSGGAQQVGAITFRMPAALVPGSVLNAFVQLVGQDPNKGFDLSSAKGKRVRLRFEAIKA